MILAYHRVNSFYDSDALSVSPDNFRRQVAYLLKRGLKASSLAEYIECALKKKAGKRFCITFDDGFADNLWHAAGVLESFKVKPLIFLTAGHIGTKKTLPRYKDILRDRFLDWQEVKDMASGGADFGSHGLTHSHLPLMEYSRIQEEVGDSKKMIEDRTGREVPFFCYPYGDFNERVVDAVRQAGYKAAVVTTGRKKMTVVNPYTIPRTGVYGHNNFLIFRAKIWKSYLTEKYS